MAKLKKVILLIEMSSNTGRDIVSGITQYANLYGPWFFCGYTGDHRGKLLDVADLNADGMIARDYGIHSLLKYSLPKIFLAGDHRLDESIPHITTEPRQITIMAINHLLDRGFTKFAFCGFSGMHWSLARRKVFEEFLADKELYSCCFKHPSKYTGYSRSVELNEMADWLVSLPKPLGLMACSDERAYHVLEACKLADIKVPEEIAIIGVDNDKCLCNMATPQLSSVGLALKKAGFEAAKVLDMLMSGKKVSEPNIWIRPTGVHIRQSTDILAIDDPDLAEALSFVRTNLKEPITVENVAEAAGVCRRTLEKKFKKYLHRTVHQEIRRCKVNEISKLLVETNMTISQIAYAMNMNSSKDVLRNFRIEKNISPLEYRTQYTY